MATDRRKFLGIIANPRAGKGWRALEPIHRLVANNPDVSLNVTTDIRLLSTTLLKLINEYKVQMLAIYGGDGTLHKVIDMLMYEVTRGAIESIPTIASINGGTMNAVFHWLGWTSERPMEICRRLLETEKEKIPRRKVRPLQITFWNPKTRTLERRYGFMFTVGCVNDIIQLYERDGKSTLTGLKHVALGAIATITNWPRSHSELIKMYPAEVFADDERIPVEQTLGALCSVTDSLIFGVKPFAGHAENNQFYCLSYAVPGLVLGALLPLEVRATWIPPIPQFFNKPVFKFKIKLPCDKDFFIDGDFFTAGGGHFLELELGPEIEMVSHFGDK